MKWIGEEQVCSSIIPVGPVQILGMTGIYVWLQEPNGVQVSRLGRAYYMWEPLDILNQGYRWTHDWVLRLWDNIFRAEFQCFLGMSVVYNFHLILHTSTTFARRGFLAHWERQWHYLYYVSIPIVTLPVKISWGLLYEILGNMCRSWRSIAREFCY